MHEVHLDFKLINENRLKAPAAVFVTLKEIPHIVSPNDMQRKKKYSSLFTIT
jgi:exopolysaccharide biosynthesis predicted pyruvyltransferase EpsI